MNIFTKHPHEMGESYLQHMSIALRYGGKMLLGGLACMIHGIFPFLFQTTGSRTAIKMANEFLNRSQAE